MSLHGASCSLYVFPTHCAVVQWCPRSFGSNLNSPHRRCSLITVGWCSGHRLETPFSLFFLAVSITFTSLEMSRNHAPGTVNRCFPYLNSFQPCNNPIKILLFPSSYAQSSGAELVTRPRSQGWRTSESRFDSSVLCLLCSIPVGLRAPREPVLCHCYPMWWGSCLYSSPVWSPIPNKPVKRAKFKVESIKGDLVNVVTLGRRRRSRGNPSICLQVLMWAGSKFKQRAKNVPIQAIPGNTRSLLSLTVWASSSSS